MKHGKGAWYMNIEEQKIFSVLSGDSILNELINLILGKQ